MTKCPFCSAEARCVSSIVTDVVVNFNIPEYETKEIFQCKSCRNVFVR